MLLGDLRFLLSHEAFNKSRPTVFYFHGWLESGQLDLSVIAIRGAYLDRGDHNMISVDWSYYAKDINYHLDVIPQEKIVNLTILLIDLEFKVFCYHHRLLKLLLTSSKNSFIADTTSAMFISLGIHWGEKN